MPKRGRKQTRRTDSKSASRRRGHVGAEAQRSKKPASERSRRRSTIASASSTKRAREGGPKDGGCREWQGSQATTKLPRRRQYAIEVEVVAMQVETSQPANAGQGKLECAKMWSKIHAIQMQWRPMMCAQTVDRVRNTACNSRRDRNGNAVSEAQESCLGSRTTPQ